MNKKQMFKLLEEFKKYVGLSDYTIQIATEYFKDESKYAEAGIDRFEKTIKIKLSDEFQKLDKKQQRNILIHELVHSRVGLFWSKVKTVMYDEEEDMVNDLTRGLEKLNQKL